MPQKIKFYTDEHESSAVARGVRERGADVLTVFEAGMRGATDEEQLHRANVEGRVIFTQDDDFLRLHAAGFEHTGIVYTPQGASIGAVIYGLMLIFQILSDEDMWGQVEYL